MSPFVPFFVPPSSFRWVKTEKFSLGAKTRLTLTHEGGGGNECDILMMVMAAEERVAKGAEC